MSKLLIGCCILFAEATAHASFGQEPEKVVNERSMLEVNLADDPDYGKLMGKWIVRSVTSDGDLTPAQIGQKDGDIISIVPRNDRTFFT